MVLWDRREDSLEATVTEPGHSRSVTVVTDGLGEGTPERLVDAALATWGRVDGALIGVGDTAGGRAGLVMDEEWAAAFETVFLGVVRLARQVAQHLRSDGSMVLVLSPSVHEPVAGRAIDTGLQRGPASLALQLAEELGPRGVRVNGLLPVAFDARGSEPGVRGDSPSHGEAPIETIPLRRRGVPDEFGRVATSSSRLPRPTSAAPSFRWTVGHVGCCRSPLHAEDRASRIWESRRTSSRGFAGRTHSVPGALSLLAHDSVRRARRAVRHSRSPTSIRAPIVLPGGASGQRQRSS